MYVAHDKSPSCADEKCLRQSACMKTREVKFEPIAPHAMSRFDEQPKRRCCISQELFAKLTQVIERHLNAQEQNIEGSLQELHAKVDQLQQTLNGHHGNRSRTD